MVFSVYIGMTLDAYVTVRINARSKRAMLKQLAALRAKGLENLDFEPDWGTADDYRLIDVVDGSNKPCLTQIDRAKYTG